MKNFILFTIISAILLLGCSSQKNFSRLDKKYQKSDFEILEKKSDKYIKKNPADPIPLYFKSMTQLYYYNQNKNPEHLLDALKYSYRANRKQVPSFLKQDLTVLNETLLQKAADDLSIIEKSGDALTAQKIHDLTRQLKELPINKNFTATAPIATNTQKPTHKKRLPEGIRKDILETSKQYLGIPYKYGGTTTRGFDCSGFTSQVFRDVGITLPRTAAMQAEAGLKINENKAKPGDLLFFHNGSNKSRITHVALIIETDQNGIYAIMHATSKGISIDKRDQPAWKSYWLPRIKMIASFIND
jgi:cell wall-associated NlpC family hydrolase